MELYVKQTSNCPNGLPLIRFELLSPIWEGESVLVPFGDEVDRDYFRVVGWTDLLMGRPCDVKVAKVRFNSSIGFLVWGGNSGVRILDPRREPEDWEAQLPAGWGMPIVWIEYAEDIPEDVLAVVEECVEHEKVR